MRQQNGEIEGKKASRDAEEGEEEKISMKSTIKLRVIELERKHLFTMVSFQVMFFFTYFVKLTKIRRRPGNVCNSVLTEILTFFNHHIYRLFV